MNSKFICRKFSTTPTFRTDPHVPNNATASFRKNILSIPMLPAHLHAQLFPNTSSDQQHDAEFSSKYFEISKQHLTNSNLFGKTLASPITANFPIPSLIGKDINDHFFSIAEERVAPYKKIISDFMSKPDLPMPKKWARETGWVRYNSQTNTDNTTINPAYEKIEYPDDDVLVLDCETMVQEDGGKYPVIATAVSEKYWYSWVSPSLARFLNVSSPILDPDYVKIDGRYPTLKHLIPIGPSPNPRIIIGHHVAYDRARILEEYEFEPSKVMYLDTMSLHSAVSGLSTQQRPSWNTYKKARDQFEDDELEESKFTEVTKDWHFVSSSNGLKECLKLHVPDLDYEKIAPDFEEDIPEIPKKSSKPASKKSKDQQNTDSKKGKKELDKRIRSDIFVSGNIPLFLQNFQASMAYCAIDVHVTSILSRSLYPKYMQKCPHPVSFYGSLQMGKGYLPASESWLDYVNQSEAKYEEYRVEIEECLLKICDKILKAFELERTNALNLGLDFDGKPNKEGVMQTPTYLGNVRSDPYLKHLDWGLKTPRQVKMTRCKDKIAHGIPTKPAWYRELWDADELRVKLSLARRVVPYLLRLKWCGYSLVHLKNHGWCYKVPKRVKGKRVVLSELGASHGTPLVFSFKEGDVQYDPAFKDQDHYYFRLPHKDGEDVNVGNPLSKHYIAYFEDGKLTSESLPTFNDDARTPKKTKKSDPNNENDNAPSEDLAKHILKLHAKCSYWISARARVASQFLVNYNDLFPQSKKKKKIYAQNGRELCVILPQTVVMGTITRRAVEPTWMTAANAKANRIGSELKAQIMAPEGHVLIGADVDSQELWISSLLGDAQFGIHGATAIGFMTLQGTKSHKTDLHSKTGELLGISRDQAKVFNYARIYGAGKKFARQLLKQYIPGLSDKEAQDRSNHLYVNTKGQALFLRKHRTIADFRQQEDVEEDIARGRLPFWRGSSFWFGGTESVMFNQLEIIAQSVSPRTPVLGCEIPDSLLPPIVKEEFLPSRVNWVVQSSGVDYLHLLLTAISYLFERMKIPGRFVLSIHDEIRYCIPTQYAPKATLALQIANLWVRALFAYKSEIMDLPLDVAFFSSVDVDKVLRKEVDMDCVTPSNLQKVENGVSMKVTELQNLVEILLRQQGVTRNGEKWVNEDGEVSLEKLERLLYGPEITKADEAPGMNVKKRMSPEVREMWLKAQTSVELDQVRKYVDEISKLYGKKVMPWNDYKSGKEKEGGNSGYKGKNVRSYVRKVSKVENEETKDTTELTNFLKSKNDPFSKTKTPSKKDSTTSTPQRRTGFATGSTNKSKQAGSNSLTKKSGFNELAPLGARFLRTKARRYTEGNAKIESKNSGNVKNIDFEEIIEEGSKLKENNDSESDKRTRTAEMVLGMNDSVAWRLVPLPANLEMPKFNFENLTGLSLFHYFYRERFSPSLRSMTLTKLAWKELSAARVSEYEYFAKQIAKDTANEMWWIAAKELTLNVDKEVTSKLPEVLQKYEETRRFMALERKQTYTDRRLAKQKHTDSGEDEENEAKLKQIALDVLQSTPLRDELAKLPILLPFPEYIEELDTLRRFSAFVLFSHIFQKRFLCAGDKLVILKMVWDEIPGRVKSRYVTAADAIIGNPANKQLWENSRKVSEDADQSVIAILSTIMEKHERSRKLNPKMVAEDGRKYEEYQFVPFPQDVEVMRDVTKLNRYDLFCHFFKYRFVFSGDKEAVLKEVWKFVRTERKMQYQEIAKMIQQNKTNMSLWNRAKNLSLSVDEDIHKQFKELLKKIETARRVYFIRKELKLSNEMVEKFGFNDISLEEKNVGRKSSRNRDDSVYFTSSEFGGEFENNNESQAEQKLSDDKWNELSFQIFPNVESSGNGEFFSHEYGDKPHDLLQPESSVFLDKIILGKFPKSKTSKPTDIFRRRAGIARSTRQRRYLHTGLGSYERQNLFMNSHVMCRYYRKARRVMSVPLSSSSSMLTAGNHFYEEADLDDEEFSQAFDESSFTDPNGPSLLEILDASKIPEDSVVNSKEENLTVDDTNTIVETVIDHSATDTTKKTRSFAENSDSAIGAKTAKYRKLKSTEVVGSVVKTQNTDLSSSESVSSVTDLKLSGMEVVSDILLSEMWIGMSRLDQEKLQQISSQLEHRPSDEMLRNEMRDLAVSIIHRNFESKTTTSVANESPTYVRVRTDIKTPAEIPLTFDGYCLFAHFFEDRYVFESEFFIDTFEYWKTVPLDVRSRFEKLASTLSNNFYDQKLWKEAKKLCIQTERRILENLPKIKRLKNVYVHEAENIRLLSIPMEILCSFNSHRSFSGPHLLAYFSRHRQVGRQGLNPIEGHAIWNELNGEEKYSFALLAKEIRSDWLNDNLWNKARELCVAVDEKVRARLFFDLEKKNGTEMKKVVESVDTDSVDSEFAHENFSVSDLAAKDLEVGESVEETPVMDGNVELLEEILVEERNKELPQITANAAYQMEDPKGKNSGEKQSVKEKLRSEKVADDKKVEFGKAPETAGKSAPTAVSDEKKDKKSTNSVISKQEPAKMMRLTSTRKSRGLRIQKSSEKNEEIFASQFINLDSDLATVKSKSTNAIKNVDALNAAKELVLMDEREKTKPTAVERKLQDYRSRMQKK
ncbi:DNA-directed DNA polymerase gamma mip1 [Nowakowskiella sp. JEL0407]|nr:DNA-directed DNA polymerase gamma mip1 [Nowakowskiella sp. JEL0407]